MFDYLRNKLKQKGKISPLASEILNDSARFDCMLQIIKTYNQNGETENLSTRILKKLNITGENPRFISYINPYPDFNSVVSNHTSENDASNDREIVASLMRAKTVDRETLLAWLHRLSIRPDLDQHRNSINEIASQIVAAGSNDQELLAVTQASLKTLQEIIPGAFKSPMNELKETIADMLFSGMIYSTQEQHQLVVPSMHSSVDLFQAVATALFTPGKTRVILPTPYFEPFPIMLELAGAQIITTDTTNDNFKMTPEHLRQVIRENKLGEGDWLMLTSPNNATMKRYTEDELQDLAQVVAETGIRVISDELYARLGTEPHHSLRQFAGYGPSGKIEMKDRVILLTGCSKQFPFAQEESSKLCATLACTPAEARRIDNHISNYFRLSDKDAQIFKSLMASTPRKVREQCCATTNRQLQKVHDMIEGLNKKFASEFGGEPPLKLLASDGYMVCLQPSEEFCRRTGIKSSNDLADYLFATTWQLARSLSGEGITQPIVRFNTYDIMRKPEVFLQKMICLVETVAKNEAPAMCDVKKAVDQAIMSERHSSSEEKIAALQSR